MSEAKAIANLAQQAKEMDVEVRAKVCRHALWIALLQAQDLGWGDVEDALVALIRDVDARGSRPTQTHATGTASRPIP